MQTEQTAILEVNWHYTKFGTETENYKRNISTMSDQIMTSPRKLWRHIWLFVFYKVFKLLELSLLETENLNFISSVISFISQSLTFIGLVVF